MHKQTIIFIGVAFAMSSIFAQSVQIGYSAMGPMPHIPDIKPVTGAPYSATAITTTTQTLADGTHIAHTIQAQMYRDSAGRTRREETINAVGPWSTGGKEQHLVSINDPVAQSHYILQPDQQMAMKVGLPTLTSMPAMPDKAIAGGGMVSIKAKQVFADGGVKTVSAGDNAAFIAGVKTFSVGDNAMFIAKEGMVTAAGGQVMLVGGSDKNAQVEDLGDQVMEGVRAHGRREKRTIAVGEIGNDRPIDVTSETWFSDELQTIVLSKRTDPRVGDSEFKLSNISRVEPDASLFQVPAGYTLKDETKGRE
jgi:hypothetical protein